MDEQRKYAYRYLLYQAILMVRPIRFFSAGWFPIWNPFAWTGTARRIRRAGAIAEWIHNLAHFSALDFRDFDEDRFWRDHDRLLREHPGWETEILRTIFQDALSETVVDSRP